MWRIWVKMTQKSVKNTYPKNDHFSIFKKRQKTRKKQSKKGSKNEGTQKTPTFSRLSASKHTFKKSKKHEKTRFLTIFNPFFHQKWPKNASSKNTVFSLQKSYIRGIWAKTTSKNWRYPFLGGYFLQISQNGPPIQKTPKNDPLFTSFFAIYVCIFGWFSIQTGQNRLVSKTG